MSPYAEVLDLSDVSYLPSGTATVFKVATNPQHTTVVRATVDSEGFLRSLDTDRNYFDREACEVVEVVG